MDLIEIFKAGTHTDSSGKTREWTDKDLQEIASLYDPANHEAPIVIGHPDIDSPAYGWIESLKVEGGKLLAKVKDVADEFKDWVGRGLYKKISIALYPDLSLRHVGFLGAMPPAVKGLKQAMFSEKPAWEIETDFQGHLPVFNIIEKSETIKTGKCPQTVPKDLERESNKGGIKMTFKDWFEKMKGLFAEAEKELAPPDTGGAKFSEADIQAAETRGKDSQFAEMEKLKKEKADLEKEKAEAASRTKEIETKARKAEIATFCETQIKEGKFTPALRKLIEPLMIFAATHEEAIEFAEGEKKSPVEILKLFIKAVPKLVEFSEVAGDEKTKVVPKDFDAAVEAVMAEKKFSRAKAITFCATQYPEIHEQYITNLKEITNK